VRVVELPVGIEGVVKEVVRVSEVRVRFSVEVALPHLLRRCFTAVPALGEERLPLLCH
jgi:hypothetical protein